MNIYAFDGPWQLDHILIVGVGGTGSALVRLVARILWQRQQLGQTVPQLQLVDGDAVEAHNVGRQHFCQGDVGHFKAELTAKRLSLIYGLPILWCNEWFDPAKHLQRGSLLVGCVDNHLARQQLVAAGEGHVYLDCGNASTYGQVVLGTSSTLEKVMMAIQHMETSSPTSRHSLYQSCHCLPNIGLLYPELLHPDPTPLNLPPDLSCAALVAQDSQHLLINDAIALACSSYIYKLLQRQPITTFMTTVDLHNQTSTSRQINPTELRQALAHAQ